MNFSTLISATPTDYGLTAPQATAYATLHDNFTTALAACDPGVRNKMVVAAKNAARATLKDSARQLAKIVNGTPTVTDAQRLQLGLNVRAVPSPIPAPSTAPVVDVVSVIGRTVKLRLHISDKGPKRGRPPGVTGAAVFSFVGATAPADPGAWTFQGNTSKTVIDVAFDTSVAAGAQVWFTAFWYNPRSQSGPGATPVNTFLQGGSGSIAA